MRLLTKEIFLKLNGKNIIILYLSETNFGGQFTNMKPAYCKKLFVERVRRKFLKYASFILGIQRPSHNYSPGLKILDLQSLADRKRILSKTFLRGLLSNGDDSLAPLSLKTFKVPQFSTRIIT